MTDPKITILIRLHAKREELFSVCMQSICMQSYKNKSVVVACDGKEAYDLMQGIVYSNKFDFGLDYFPVVGAIKPDDISDAPYNFYCNQLKAVVKEGWFMFLDSDDMFASVDSLLKISKHLDMRKYKAVVCQMSRGNGVTKPSIDMLVNKQVISGRVGMPCIFTHFSVKDIAHFDGTSNADFKYIKKLTDSTNSKFIDVVVVHSPKRRFGK